ncbi:DUF2167 domain-containing protein [Pseudomonas sp. LFM046]|uniref:DUF2167 domain-containing protein n=1 Tax=Pseudomonas sp. LFM046 TaxID=1608357 RepID=UPI0005CFD9ED|nr:DUF2167 domain-containing protein [Pseudomonas sp. LFM046]
MSIKELILAVLLAVSLPSAFADQPQPREAAAQPEQGEGGGTMTAEEFVTSLNFRSGKVVVGDNLATFDLPEQFVFLDGKDVERVLVDAWGNPPSDELPLGLILPKGVSPLAEESWAVKVEYQESGYVSDEDAAEINYGELLQDMKADVVAANKWRADNGYEPLELIGWAAPPRYDSEGRKLYWAKELRFGDAPTHILNYNIRVLGRKGVLVLNFIANMDQLPIIEQHLPAVLAMTEFNPGNRYVDFNPELDEVAAYGLGALVAGKLAAKTGLLALVLVFLKKFFFVPVAIGGWLWSRLRGKKAAVAVRSELESLPEAVQPPTETVMAPSRDEKFKD